MYFNNLTGIIYLQLLKMLFYQTKNLVTKENNIKRGVTTSEKAIKNEISKENQYECNPNRFAESF